MNHPISIGDQKAWHERLGEDKRYEYDITPKDWVIDIGGFEGEFAKKIAEKFDCTVVIFEPTDAIDKIEFLDNFVRVKAAAWTYYGEINLGGESFWVSSKERYNNKQFRCIDIFSWLIQLRLPDGVNDLALVKINIEGGEYELLNYIIDKRLHLQVRNFQVQFHMIEGEDYLSAYAKIVDRLCKTHKLTWREPFVWENWELIEQEEDMEVQSLYRYCRACKKETPQMIRLFNPDDPDQGEVYECAECHNAVDFVN